MHTLKPLEQADIKLTLLNRLNDVFNNVHPDWSLSTGDIREVVLLYLNLTTGERWCLSKIISQSSRKQAAAVSGLRPVTAHLHTGPGTPCPPEEITP